MSAKCDCCGAESNLDTAFFKAPKSFSQKIRTYCPDCWTSRQHSESKWGIILSLATGPLGLVFLLTDTHAELGWFMINIVLFEVFIWLTIVPHELAHAVVGRAVGMKVLRIYLGSGRTFFTSRVAGFDCEFKPLPTGGLVVAAHRTLEHLRARHFAFVLAGPAANFLMATAVWMFSSPGTLWRLSSMENGFAPGPAFFYANLLVLLMNLWPKDAATILGPLPTDGKQLFQIVSLPAEKLDVYHAAGFVMETSLLHQQGDHRKALACVDAGLSIYPENEMLLHWKGVFSLDLGNYGDARLCFVKLLERSNLPSMARPIILNNIAYADALLDREDLHEEADSYSQEAMAAMSWVPAIRGTRGTVLVAMGRLEEGLLLLRESMSQAAIPGHKAANACLIAEAESRMGNFSAARDYLDQARRLDPGCLLLHRAESILDREVASLR